MNRLPFVRSKRSKIVLALLVLGFIGFCATSYYIVQSIQVCCGPPKLTTPAVQESVMAAIANQAPINGSVQLTTNDLGLNASDCKESELTFSYAGEEEVRVCGATTNLWQGRIEITHGDTLFTAAPSIVDSRVEFGRTTFEGRASWLGINPGMYEISLEQGINSALEEADLTPVLVELDSATLVIHVEH